MISYDDWKRAFFEIRVLNWRIFKRNLMMLFIICFLRLVAYLKGTRRAEPSLSSWWEQGWRSFLAKIFPLTVFL